MSDTETYPIDFKPKPCMKSGFCCTLSPCEYGEWNNDKSACKYLSPPNDVGQRGCERFGWIKENVPNWEFYPAFGAGCCSPIGNILRNNIIKTLIAKKENGENITPYISHINKADEK